MNQLLEQGVIVLPTSFVNEEKRKEKQQEFMKTLSGFKEFNAKGKQDKNFQLGGFGALGNPSSFHNKFVRNTRLEMNSELLKSLFSEFLQQDEELLLEQIIDRMMFRKKGNAPGRESFHRDDSGGLPEDLTFGGWLNLDDFPHKFSCVKGSQELDPENKKEAGFNLIPKHLQKTMKSRSEIILIPAGHAIIFFDNIIHEVLSQKAKEDTRRLFLGFRLTKSKIPLIPKIQELLQDQATIPLKSKQIPAMYSTLHICSWFDRLLEFTEGVEDFVKIQHTFKSGERKGNTFTICSRFLPSLKDLSKKSGKNLMYPKYSEEELKIYLPNRP